MQLTNDAPLTFDPYASAGVFRRVAPFVAAIGFGLLLIPLQAAPIQTGKLALAIGAITALVVLAVTVGRVSWVPPWLPRSLPFLYLLAIALLREATGGSLSGYGALFFLAPFWVALYDTRRQVVLVVIAMFVVQAVTGLFEAELGDITALRRAILSASIIGFISLAVQRNVSGLRFTRMHLERNQSKLREALEREVGIVEQLQELDRLKTRFVAMASHELRTPLASITGFAATLRERWDDIPEGDRLDYITIMDEQGKRLSRLVDDLLVLSRIESGSLHPKLEPVELDSSIRLVLAGLGAEHDVAVTVPSTAIVNADRDHVEQMLVNYVSNALKYGSAPITVESRERDGHVEIIVRDSGSGVPEDVAPVLFEEFARASSHAARHIEGTGLGLSIVRGLARAQGGDVFYEPNEPNGSVFGLRLPAAAASSTAVAAPQP